jgi:hypothetical protein
MTVIVSIDPEMAEFETEDGEEPRLTLILSDTDDQQHQLIVEGRALRQLATLFRAIQERFPGILSD